MNEIKMNSIKTKNFFLSNGFYFLLGLLVILFSIISDPFFTLENFFQLSLDSCFLLATCAGLSVVVITGNIDLTVGSVTFLVAAIVGATSGLPPLISLLLGVFIGAFIGLINGILVSVLKMNSILTTLGFMIAYRGIGLMIVRGSQAFPHELIKNAGKIKFIGIPFIFLLSLVLMIILQVILSRTKFGAFCYAIGNSDSASMRLGIPVRVVKTGAFVISGIGAAIAGILYNMYIGVVSPFTGKGMEFTAIAAVVIGGVSLFGGIGNIIPGTFFGVLLLIVIRNGLGTLGVSPYIYPFIQAGVIFLAMYIDSLKNYRRTIRVE